MKLYKEDYEKMVKEMVEKLIELSVKHKDASIIDVFAPEYMSYSNGVNDIIEQRAFSKLENAQVVKENMIESIVERIEERLYDVGVDLEEDEE